MSCLLRPVAFLEVGLSLGYLRGMTSLERYGTIYTNSTGQGKMRVEVCTVEHLALTQDL